MAKKILSVRVENELLEQVNYFGEKLKVSQAELVTMAIENLINDILSERHGGATIKLPNPNNYLLSEEAKNEVLDLLNKTNFTLTQITNSGLDLGLNLIKQFAEDRLKRDSKEDKEKFVNNQIEDSKFFETLKGGEK